MNRVPVASSNVASIGFDEESCTLEVEFNNGSVYQYFDVPSYLHSELMSADSVGSYLARNIKGSYGYQRV
ncbi:KTSC domain-containing protein [Ferrimonas sediminum]|uniref:KTSC domain-containing protein n=1 Tax=Ferrimonas sediminum TaxID=718193 RepID=A0A1G8Y9Z0_9GAMM|nr:KTSC domain-containing protein [Ferrimonas sediminum]SDJ99709.1 KTSC domain-containing protein [Ferrimonas sediminum]